MMFQKTGYSSKDLTSNLALGIFDGIDSVLWCYAFATIIFTNVLAVYLPLGLVILLGGWALTSIFVALTSRARVHMISIDEQAVVIIGSIAIVMISTLGEEAASLRGLATLLAIMSIVSLSVSLSFFVCSRFQVSRLLELLPYPVISGFMAGIGWLLLEAGVMVAIDTSISLDLLHALQQGNNSARLLACLSAGVFLLWFTSRIEATWALPVASTAVVVLFYISTSLAGYELSTLKSDGWMFDLPNSSGEIAALLGDLRLAHIDIEFIVSIIPQLLAVIFLTMLAASMNLSTLSAINLKAGMNSNDELRSMAGGNLLCGLICSPPGHTDAPASVLYEGFGANSRWMPLASSLVCLLVAAGGGWLVSYTPKVLIGATIFLFAFQLFYDWLYQNVRNFSRTDYAIVCTILATVILTDFMHGILVGFLLTVVVFVLRYSMIPVIQDQYSLNDHRSSVERSAFANLSLEKHGGEALVYTLRGFLFFGTANSIRDTIRDSIENGRYILVLLDLRRVTGVDVSALNALAQTKQICDLHNVQLLYSSHDEATLNRLVALGAVGLTHNGPLIFSDTDFAIEKMEDILLARYAAKAKSGSIRHYLMELLDSEEKVAMLLEVMERQQYQSGNFLFHQGDPDTGFYILESGSMSALISTGKGRGQRVKKFNPGSVIGEMSSYTPDKRRSASVVAESESVLYHLDPQKLASMTVVHELVAQTLGVRMDYMNRRLLWELS